MPDFSAMREKLFQKADGNGDSALSLQEFQEAGKKMPGGNSMSPDKAKEAFGKIDRDGNGALSKDEMKAFGERMSSEMQSAMVGLQAMQGGGMPDPTSLFADADEDKDGKVSRTEFDRTGPGAARGGGKADDRANQLFGMIDGDGDGSLTQDELKRFGEQMGQGSGSAVGGSTAEFQQALGAYRQGSQQQTDLTALFLKALDGSKGIAA